MGMKYMNPGSHEAYLCMVSHMQPGLYNLPKLALLHHSFNYIARLVIYLKWYNNSDYLQNVLKIDVNNTRKDIG